MPKIRVLVVDDSALVRRLLKTILENDPDLEVVAQAPNPNVARELIKRTNPDVITLDIEMPEMDGLTFLSNLMRLRPTPVVMISSLTDRGAQITFDALALGAVDFVSKPKLDMASGLEEAALEIVAKVKAAARVTPRPATANASTVRPPPVAAGFRTTDRLIAIGASTGGTEAIREVLMQFPPDAPGTVIVQHIPPGYSRAFADRLNRNCALGVMQAEDGQRVLPGHAYVAPGGLHLRVERRGAQWICRVEDGPAVNQHKPSVDILFESVARSAGINAVGAILTGMGADGAKGLKAMRGAGAYTIAQDEASSVVWGMPGSAVRLNAVDLVLPLDRVAGQLINKALR
jgi:two-component system chemotaxis response regulator CheB